MSEIKRALDRLEKAVEILKFNFNREKSSAEQSSRIDENELSELKIIKNQITSAISYIEQMSLAENKKTRKNSEKFDKDNETGERP